MAKNKNEAMIKFKADTGSFDDSIKQSEKTLKQLRSEFKLNSEQMKITGSSIEGLEANHKNLEDQLKESQSKTEALNKKLEVAVECFGENSDVVAKLKKQLMDAQLTEIKLQQAINTCNKEIEEQTQAAKEAESATGKLKNTISSQREVVDRLKKAYVEAVLQYGKNSDEAKALEKQLKNLSKALDKNEEALQKVSNKADKLDKSLGDTERSSKEAEEGFTILGGTLANLAANALQGVIRKVGEFVSYLGKLPEATRELRQDLATLTTSFEETNHSTSQATDTWKELYKVFGEDDRAVETANHIARLSDNQEDLNKWVTISTGIWGKYQDSLDPAALAESAVETRNVGVVTGNLADALNWSSEAATMFSKYMSEDVTTAEEAFNVALSECNTEAERQALITDTLTALYGDAATTYRDTASAQMEAKEATAENILAEANLAAAIEPITTEFNNLKTQILTDMLPVIEKLSGAIVSALEWAQEHPVQMRILGIAIATLAGAITAITTVVTIWTVAQWALNSAILANPITWIVVVIVAAIAAVVAIIVVVIEYWDEIVAAVKKAASAIVNALQTAWNWIVNLFKNIVGWIDTYVIQPIIAYYTFMFNLIVTVFTTTIEWIKNAFITAWEWIKSTPIFQFFSELFTSIWNTIKSTISVIVTLIKGTWETIKAVWGIVSTWFNEKVIQPVSNFFSALWNGVKNKATNTWNGIKNVFSKVSGWFNEKVVEPVSNFFSSMWGKLKSGASSAWGGIKSIFSNVAGFFGEKFSAAWEKVKNIFSVGGKIFSGIKEGIESAFKKIVNAIISGINKVVSVPFNAINDALAKIRGVSIAGVSPFSGLPTISVPQIPLLAEGGILTKPTLNIAGEAGPEAIIPIDKLESYMENAIEKAMQIVNLQALAVAVEDLANRPIHLNINGRKFAEATVSDNDNVSGLRNSFKSRGLAIE